VVGEADLMPREGGTQAKVKKKNFNDQAICDLEGETRGRRGVERKGELGGATGRSVREGTWEPRAVRAGGRQGVRTKAKADGSRKERSVLTREDSYKKSRGKPKCRTSLARRRTEGPDDGKKKEGRKL